mmetsp:Transcript_26883/g.42467  ORF Transcript_26883/g.42467 Transcript_26883/m.42467 type:complete len:101 (-) Transcript_26883:713-1015(-)
MDYNTNLISIWIQVWYYPLLSSMMQAYTYGTAAVFTSQVYMKCCREVAVRSQIFPISNSIVADEAMVDEPGVASIEGNSLLPPNIFILVELLVGFTLIEN